MSKRLGIYGKIWVSFIVTIIITTLVLALSMSFFLDNYLTTDVKDTMLSVSDRLCEDTIALLSEKANEVEQYKLNDYRHEIDWAARASDSSIYVFNAFNQDDKKPVLFSSSAKEAKWAEGIDEYIDRAKNNERFFINGKLGSAFEDKMITLFTPVYYNGGVQQVIVMSASKPELSRTHREIMKTFMVAAVIAALVATLIALYLTRRLTRPIRRMTKAAKKIAQGDFSVEIPVTGGDELGQLAESFNKMTKSLGELENMRSAFVSDVSHELRTPVTVISGFIEGVLDGTIPENEREKYLCISLEESRRLSRMVESLLESTRVERQKLSLKMTDFDVVRLLKERVIANEARIEEKHIDLAINFEPDSILVNADSDLVHRVVVNLLDNAIKFTPDGGKISISAKAAGKVAVISIENTGEGIAPEKLEHIWERFYKTDESRGSGKGFGLGLYIVKSIIDAHDTRIVCESEAGKFARFTFTLNLNK